MNGSSGVHVGWMLTLGVSGRDGLMLLLLLCCGKLLLRLAKRGAARGVGPGTAEVRARA